MNSYQEKRQAKIERLKELAEKHELKSTQCYQAAKQIGSFIPMGQPILIGHHSEGRHRRDLNKIDNNMRKSIEHDKTAEYYANRVESMENDNSISSDDPEAVTKLKEKIARLEKNQQLMKDLNKVLKSKKLDDTQKLAKLIESGIKEQDAAELMKPYYGVMGVPSFSLTNNNANINRLKKRLQSIEKRATLTTTSKEYGAVTMTDNTEENRLQIFFPGKPSDEVRTILKRSGYRWSPSNGCWQSYRNRHSQYGGYEAIKLHNGEATA